MPVGSDRNFWRDHAYEPNAVSLLSASLGVSGMKITTKVNKIPTHFQEG